MVKEPGLLGVAIATDTAEVLQTAGPFRGKPMSELAEQHRQIADVLAPLERMGVDATLEDRNTADGDLCLTLSLELPATLNADGGQTRDLTARSWNLSESGGEITNHVERVATLADDLEARIADLERGGAGAESDSNEYGGDNADVAEDGLTDGERETLHALQELGGTKSSEEIAAEVDATLQSVRSWLPKLGETGH